MPEHVLAIDAGTTTLRALVVSPDGEVVGRARTSCPLNYPRPGWVEQDAEAVWQAVLSIAKTACADAELMISDIASVGITSQRSCCVVWERATGKPLAPLVSWQDLRGVQRAKELAVKGYPTQPQAAAVKLEAVLEEIPDGRCRANAGEICWGNVETYLTFRLSGGSAYITDATQACATGYYDFHRLGWHQELLGLQQLPESFFPALVDTYGNLGVTNASIFGDEIPIGAIVADQQCAAFAQQCRDAGQNKMTYGTSGTCDVHSGTKLVEISGTYPLVLMKHSERVEFCVEGMVITAGAVFDWLAEGLGIIEEPADSAALAAEVSASEGVYVLPALQGLGSPHFDPAMRMEIGGLSRGSNRAHVVRAAMEGVSFRVREMLDAIYQAPQLKNPNVLRADGGAAGNDILMQIQADILGCPVERMEPLEATAYGAALLAGLGCGLWTDADLQNFRHVDRVFEPRWSEDEREKRYAAWRSACSLESAI